MCAPIVTAISRPHHPSGCPRMETQEIHLLCPPNAALKGSQDRPQNDTNAKAGSKIGRKEIRKAGMSTRADHQSCWTHNWLSRLLVRLQFGQLVHQILQNVPHGHGLLEEWHTRNKGTNHVADSECSDASLLSCQPVPNALHP